MCLLNTKAPTLGSSRGLSVNGLRKAQMLPSQLRFVGTKVQNYLVDRYDFIFLTPIFSSIDSMGKFLSLKSNPNSLKALINKGIVASIDYQLPLSISEYEPCCNPNSGAISY